MSVIDFVQDLLTKEKTIFYPCGDDEADKYRDGEKLVPIFSRAKKEVKLCHLQE